MLLERNDVNPSAADEHGQTRLFIAARKGRKAAVERLLERVDVNSDMTDLAGETPLSQALKRGCDAIVKFLSAHRNSNFPFRWQCVYNTSLTRSVRSRLAPLQQVPQVLVF